MGWYLGVIGRLHNEDAIYIFTLEVKDVTTNIFKNHSTTVGLNNLGVNFHLFSLILHTIMFIFFINLREIFKHVTQLTPKP